MDALKLIEFEEGYQQFPYRCTANKLTVGIGRNLEVNGVSLEEARCLAMNDIRAAETGLSDSLPWFSGLDVVRRAVLISMVFQMGLQAVLKFKRTLREVERGEYENAASFMLESLWAQQTPKRARRAAEMMRTGEWCAEVKE